MPVCVNGHESSDDEFCDVCGLAFGSPGTPPAEPVAAPEPEPVARPCPVCGAPLEGRFCESCGSDSLAPAAEPGLVADPGEAFGARENFAVEVRADHAYYETVRTEGGAGADPVEFPPFCPLREFSLRGKQMSIGRRSVSRGIMPDIDLTGPPEDAGVSRMHALLVSDERGRWSIVDMDSANGTYLNDERTPLKPNTPHPLAEGDEIHLGAWTTLRVIQD